ncbi:MAG: hypothetical protein ACJ8FY_07485 [Gemmataceae bacterium]
MRTPCSRFLVFFLSFILCPLSFARAVVLLLSFVLCPLSFARAALDAEADKPYQVQIVLHFGDQRLLTRDFKDQVQREIGESMQAALGDLGQVQIVPDHPFVKILQSKGMRVLDDLENSLGLLSKPEAVKKSPLLKDLDPKGLEVLAAWKRLEPAKTYFVFIDYVDDQYRIQARQHDGSTGVNSALRDPEHSSDREFVGRAATLLLARDFGIVGTVTGQQSDSLFQVTFHAGALDGPLENWIKKNDILALVNVDSNAPARPTNFIPKFLLQVQEAPVKGASVCQLLAREGSTLAAAGGPGQGIRCIRLATTRGPLRLRLLKEGSRPPIPEPKVQLQVRSHSFKDEANEAMSTDKDGRTLDSKGGVYDQVAFVNVYSQGNLLEQLPVPILEEGYFDYYINLKPKPLYQTTFNLELWNRRLYEKASLAGTLLESLPGAPPDQRQATLKKAQSGLSQIEEDIRRLEKEKSNITAEIKSVAPKGAPPQLTSLLNQGDSNMKALGQARDDLRKWIKGQEEIIKAENDPERKAILELVQKADALENQAEFGKALEVYRELEEKLKASNKEDKKVQNHIADLAKIWETRDPELRKARSFIYDTWPKLDYSGSKADLDAFKANIDRARKALETCKKAGDYLTPLKLSKGTSALSSKLQQRYTNILPTAPQNLEEAEAVSNLDPVIKELGALLSEITAYLEEKKSAPK